MPVYRPVLCEPAADFILSLPRRRQLQAMNHARQLGRRPFTVGDYFTKDTHGHVIENLLLGPYVFSFWIDHAACLVMITEIENAD